MKLLYEYKNWICLGCLQWNDIKTILYAKCNKIDCALVLYNKYYFKVSFAGVTKLKNI